MYVQLFVMHYAMYLSYIKFNAKNEWERILTDLSPIEKKLFAVNDLGISVSHSNKFSK